MWLLTTPQYHYNLSAEASSFRAGGESECSGRDPIGDVAPPRATVTIPPTTRAVVMAQAMSVGYQLHFVASGFRLCNTSYGPNRVTIMSSAHKFLTVRVLLVSLVSVLIIPVMAYAIFDIEQHKEALVSASQDNALRLVRITAADTSRKVAEIRNFLAKFAQMPSVRNLDRNNCAPQFTDFAFLHEDFANLLSKTTNGAIICSSIPTLAGARQQDFTISIDELIRTKSFTIGRPNKGIISGRWVVTLEYPIFDDSNILKGMVGAAIDLAKFNPLIGESAYSSLPEQTIAAIVDSKGIVIARSLEPDKWVGTDRSSYPVISKVLKLKTGVLRITSGIDNIERFYGITPITGTNWYATVGIPTGPTTVAIQHEYQNSLTIIFCGFSVLLLFSLWLGRMIDRPLSAVARTAAAVAQGHFNERTPYLAKAGVAEVATVARQLDAMLDALDQERRNVAEGEHRIHIMAHYDQLTHLPNRRFLHEHLRQTLMALKERHAYRAVLVVDLDNFKGINDARGHTVGDELIVTTSERLLTCVRPRDLVSRVGGDEFVIILDELGNDSDGAASISEEVAERILDAIRKPYEIEDYLYHTTGSIGIFLFHDGSEGVDELLKRADAAMYLAKGSGKNTLRFHDPILQAGLEARMSLEVELHKALSKNQFEIYYQPLFDNASRIVGAESLLRWIHPDRGKIPPAHFIGLAEESGLIVEIGEWVMRAACQQLLKWSVDPCYNDMYLAVNVSARQFAQGNFIEMAHNIIHETGANPSKLKLEVTESLVLTDVDGTIEKMRQLQDIGITFAIDDFGTGYSSLSYLRKLPLSQLKIDRSFVADITNEPNAATIVRTIIGMAHTLELTVVAEGVETVQQYAFLKRNGCDCFQGYLLGRPVPLPEFQDLIANHYKHSATEVV